MANETRIQAYLAAQGQKPYSIVKTLEDTYMVTLGYVTMYFVMYHGKIVDIQVD